MEVFFLVSIDRRGFASQLSFSLLEQQVLKSRLVYSEITSLLKRSTEHYFLLLLLVQCFQMGGMDVNERAVMFRLRQAESVSSDNKPPGSRSPLLLLYLRKPNSTPSVSFSFSFSLSLSRLIPFLYTRKLLSKP